MTWASIVRVLCGGGMIVVLAACDSNRDRPPAVEKGGAANSPGATRGYIVISLDTLRADHLGCYGYARATSPFLDSLAEHATVFEEAYASYPSTLVSHMSMFTGLHPRQHGVLFSHEALSAAVETFPEVFQRAGFRTAAYTEGGFMSGRFGFRRGFDEFVARDRNANRPLQGIFRRGAGFLESLGAEDRFLLFLHTYAIHTPYDAPAHFREAFWSGPAPADAIPATGPAFTRHNATGGTLSAPAIAWLTAHYDAGIRETDEVLRQFFAVVERLGMMDSVTVVITSDHGEELQDHGLLNHTQLYREVMRVPLLVLHPERRQPVRHAGIVRLVDLAPTLYQLAGLEPSGPTAGTALGPLLGRQSTSPIAADAWIEGPEGRALYRGERGALRSVIVTDRPPEWINRRFETQVAGGPLQFEARAFREPRRLSLRQGGSELLGVALTAEWQAVRLEHSSPGRLWLEADGCASPDPSARADFQCFAFQTRGLPLVRAELYDIAHDPKQRHDLSGSESLSLRSLLQDLRAFRPALVAAPSSAPVDRELAERLRALGYLE
jgi:Sulfatase